MEACRVYGRRRADFPPGDEDDAKEAVVARAARMNRMLSCS